MSRAEALQVRVSSPPLPLVLVRTGLRVVGWGLAGLLGLAALAVLATNVLLRTQVLRGVLNADPSSLVVEYQGAASWLPGRVSFDSLTLRTRDQNVELAFSLEHVDLRVSLRELLGRRFHATRVRAASLSFRLRERLRPDEATGARLARYPRIPGYSDPPLLQATPTPPAPAGNPWRVVIDDLAVASVGEIWIDSWRWTGSGTVVGSFELLPGLEARVGPARLEVVAGDLRHGTSRVAGRTHGAVWCVLPRFDTQAYPGNDVWKIVSGGSDLRGELTGLELLSSDDQSGPRFSGGVGSVRERVELRDGVGTLRLEIAARELTVRDGKRKLKGSARVDLHATGIDFHRGQASLAGTKVHLSDVAVDGAPARPWSGSFSAPAARLRFADGALDADLVGQLRDARPIVALMPPGLPRWIAGLLRLRDLHLSGRLALGPSRLALTSLQVSSGTFSLVGDYREVNGRSRGAFRAKKGLLSVRFKVPKSG